MFAVALVLFVVLRYALSSRTQDEQSRDIETRLLEYPVFDVVAEILDVQHRVYRDYSL